MNISSIGGKMTFPLGTLYHGTKFAVEGLSEALHYELDADRHQGEDRRARRMIATDFGGRSFDFKNDESRWRSISRRWQKLFAGFQNALVENGIPGIRGRRQTSSTRRHRPTAADQLRYTAGPDAAELMKNRKLADDATFIGGIKAQFGI